MKNKNEENLGAVHTHTHTPIFYKRIKNIVSLWISIDLNLHAENLIKQNRKMGYCRIQEYIKRKNLISLSFL